MNARLVLHDAVLDELSPRALFELLRLRVDVFVVEQTCPYPELDERDVLSATRHLRALSDDLLVGCARILAPEASDDAARIGRVAVRESRRGQGVAHALMERALAIIAEEFPGHPVELGAQIAAEGFYRLLGFRRCSAEYLEDGIPHVDMMHPGPRRNP